MKKVIPDNNLIKRLINTIIQSQEMAEHCFLQERQVRPYRDMINLV